MSKSSSVNGRHWAVNTNTQVAQVKKGQPNSLSCTSIAQTRRLAVEVAVPPPIHPCYATVTGTSSPIASRLANWRSSARSLSRERRPAEPVVCVTSAPLERVFVKMYGAIEGQRPPRAGDVASPKVPVRLKIFSRLFERA
eukprot:scaffold1655_cov247-Pinguiococcus_pyrenoidosus.AAC.4